MSLTGSLHGLPLSAFPDLFRSLPVVPVESLNGLYSGQFTGPLWLRLLARPALWLGGLPGWWGKRIAGPGDSFNVLHQGQEIVPSVPFRLERHPSLIDGRPGVSLIYPETARLPLRWLVDELRPLDQTALLGMTMLNRFGLHRLPAPFLLHRLGPTASLTHG